MVMKLPPEPGEEFEDKLKKKVRLQKFRLKSHQILHESGRSLKDLWRRIIERSKELQEKRDLGEEEK